MSKKIFGCKVYAFSYENIKLLCLWEKYLPLLMKISMIVFVYSKNYEIEQALLTMEYEYSVLKSAQQKK